MYKHLKNANFITELCSLISAYDKFQIFSKVSLGKLEYKKLQEVCLSGIKKHNFTITEKEETLPQKVQVRLNACLKCPKSPVPNVSIHGPLDKGSAYKLGPICLV